MKWKQTVGSVEGWATSARKAIEKMRGLLTEACHTSLQLKKNFEEPLSVETGRGDTLEA